MKDASNLTPLYWTDVELRGNIEFVRYRFPLRLGMLRAAEWAKFEIEELADRYVLFGGNVGRAQNMLMPYATGKRKAIHWANSMFFFIARGQFQLAMCFSARTSPLHKARIMREAVRKMAQWMGENAYKMKLQ